MVGACKKRLFTHLNFNSRRGPKTYPFRTQAVEVLSFMCLTNQRVDGKVVVSIGRIFTTVKRKDHIMRIPKYFLSNLTVLTILIFGAVSARAFGEILRNADGSLMYVTHFNAMKACPAGTRLPTAREFASESQARGAKGILEENQVDPNNIPRGYDKVVAFDGPVAVQNLIKREPWALKNGIQ